MRLTISTSAEATRARLRWRNLALFGWPVRLCRWKARLRTTLPVPVNRKRLAALRLVLSFDDITGTHSAQRPGGFLPPGASFGLIVEAGAARNRPARTPIRDQAR